MFKKSFFSLNAQIVVLEMMTLKVKGRNEKGKKGKEKGRDARKKGKVEGRGKREGGMGSKRGRGERGNGEEEREGREMEGKERERELGRRG